MSGSLTHQLNQYVTDLQQQGLYRYRQVRDDKLINFSSNDYLSLTSDPRIKKAYQHGYHHYPTGSGGSMVVCGYHSTHKQLEKAFAEALSVDECLFFPSGYAANLSIISLLARLDAHILIDKMVHASIYDGLQLSKASFSRYLHNDLADLASKLKEISPNTMLLTEGVFSMSGQSAPLSAIAKLCKPFVHGSIIDEAHAFGVLGYQGLGATVQHCLTQDDVPMRVIPLGKAFAASGAIVAGQSLWIDALLQSSRPYIYSTAISPAFAHGLLETLDVIRGANERRSKLYELVNYFREGIQSSSLTWRDSLSPIQQLQLGCPQLASYYAKKLREQGMMCLPMRQPTVSKQETGLRIILNYNHSPEQIDALLTCLNQL